MRACVCVCVCVRRVIQTGRLLPKQWLRDGNRPCGQTSVGDFLYDLKECLFVHGRCQLFSQLHLDRSIEFILPIVWLCKSLVKVIQMRVISLS